jgi:hypothetical protein
MSHIPTTLGITLHDTSSGSATARRAGRLIAFHVTVPSILSVEPIWVVTAAGIIVDSDSR